VTHAQTWASYSAVYRFGNLSHICTTDGILLIFVQKITFILWKIYKICCNQSRFCLKCAPSCL